MDNTTLLTLIHRDLGRMEGKIDALHERFDRKDKMCDSHQIKLDELTNYQTKQRGAVLILGVLGGGIVIFADWLFKFLHKGTP